MAGISLLHCSLIVVRKRAKIGDEVGKHTMQQVHPRSRIPKKRISCAKKKASLLEKKKRIAQSQAKLVREMEAREREGCPSYSSGAFNEEALPGPKSAKRQKKIE